MPSTEFTDLVTHIEADWANAVDALVYDVFHGAQTKLEALQALGLDNGNVDITGGKINNTTIGIDVPSTAIFQWAKSVQLPVDPQHLTNKEYVDSLFQNAIGGDFTLQDNVTIIGTSVGAKDAGYVFPQGMTFTEFVEAISIKVIHPTYYAPSITISGNPNDQVSYEIGTLISTLNISSSFDQQDSGGLASGTPGSYKFYIDGVLTPGATPQNAPVLSNVVVDHPINYVMTVDYAQGPVKNNNLGQPDSTGRINAGTATSNTIVYQPYRAAFFGTPTSTPSVSADVRSLGNNSPSSINNGGVDSSGVDLIPSPVPNFVITIPSGATRVTFAYPATSRAVASVRYQELSDSEVKANFTEQSLNVEGANGFTAIAYRVYTYVPVEPFSQQVHYKVFI